MFSHYVNKMDKTKNRRSDDEWERENKGKKPHRGREREQKRKDKRQWKDID